MNAMGQCGPSSAGNSGVDIVHADDMNMAKALMGKRMKVAPAVAESVVVSGNPTKPADTEKS